MNLILVRLTTVVALIALCATAAYWVIALAGRDTSLPPPAAPAPVAQINAAPNLFGGRAAGPSQTDVHVVGILNLGPNEAAAIVSTNNGTPRVLSVGAAIEGGTRIAEVKPNSIVLDTDGRRSEVFLPKSEQAQGYLR